MDVSPEDESERLHRITLKGDLFCISSLSLYIRLERWFQHHSCQRFMSWGKCISEPKSVSLHNLTSYTDFCTCKSSADTASGAACSPSPSLKIYEDVTLQDYSRFPHLKLWTMQIQSMMYYKYAHVFTLLPSLTEVIRLVLLHQTPLIKTAFFCLQNTRAAGRFLPLPVNLIVIFWGFVDGKPPFRSTQVTKFTDGGSSRPVPPVPSELKAAFLSMGSGAQEECEWT